jgi:microcystin degradation protein MlrC
MRVPLDASGILALGIDPDQLDIIVLKDRVHHRAYWDAHVKLDFPIDAPGLGPADLSILTYHNAPADAYPIGSSWRNKGK